MYPHLIYSTGVLSSKFGGRNFGIRLRNILANNRENIFTGDKNRAVKSSRFPFISKYAYFQHFVNSTIKKSCATMVIARATIVNARATIVSACATIVNVRATIAVASATIISALAIPLSALTKIIHFRPKIRQARDKIAPALA